jgi:hypothetical protein
MLIHIGYHKTGTTWLQKTLFERPGKGFFPINKKGFIPDQSDKYAEYAHQVAHQFFFTHPLQFDGEGLRDKIRDEIDWARKGVPVLSSERLSGNPHSGGYDSKEIAYRLHTVFPGAKIFIVIREQSSMILSNYFQYLSYGGARSLKDYIGQEYDGRIPLFSKDHFRYHNLLKLYQKLFGKSQVLVLPYEMFKRNPEAFIETLSKFSGANIPLDLPYARYENRGTGRLVLNLTRLLNLFLVKDSINAYSPLSPFAPRYGRRIIRGLKATLNIIVPEAMDRMFVQRQFALVAKLTSGYYEDSNAITSRCIGIDLAEYGYKRT